MQQVTTFGPPGTGKTWTLRRHLIDEVAAGIRPQDVCWTTFTNNAAHAAKAQAIAEVGGDPDDYDLFGTLHSVCGKLLNFDWRGRLVSERDKDGQALLASFGTSYGFAFDFARDHDVEADAFGGDAAEGNRLLAWWSWARQCELDVETAITRWRALSTATTPPDRYRRFAEAYEEWKADAGQSDFTDVLVLADRRRVRPDVSVLFVDEAQDLSPLQWRIIDRWRAATPRVYLGGDDDQAIYSFQGADAGLFLSRAAEGEIVKLDQSHRMPWASWSVATHLSGRIATRIDKPFRPTAEQGIALERPLFRVPFRDGGSWFVLARNTYLLREARVHLEQHGIAYTSRRGFDPVAAYYPAARAITDLARGRAVIRDDFAALVRRLRPGDDVDPSLIKRLRQPHTMPVVIEPHELGALGLSDAFLDQLQREPIPVRNLHLVSASGKAQFQTWNYLVRLHKNYGPDVFGRTPAVMLSTIHGVKGEEADHVVLLTDMARASLRTLDTDPDSEHRVWYVGASRAKRSLYLVPPLTEVCYTPLVNGGWKALVPA